MNTQNDELGNRHQHRWSGLDRDKDIAALADKLAEVVDNLFNHDGALVQLDPTGKLLPVNRAALHDIITKHIAAVRVVNRGSAAAPIYQCEYHPFSFEHHASSVLVNRGSAVAPAWRHEHVFASRPCPNTLDALYRTELSLRIPKVEV